MTMPAMAPPDRPPSSELLGGVGGVGVGGGGDGAANVFSETLASATPTTLTPSAVESASELAVIRASSAS